MFVYLKEQRLSITLVEAVTVIAIFAVIAVTTGSILFTTTRSGSRLADKVKTFQDITWATDYMVNEARWGVDFEVNPDPFADFDLVTFQSDIGHDGVDGTDTCVWYWRGFTTTAVPVTVYGDADTLYRGVDDTCNADLAVSLRAANTTRQELTGFLVDNPQDPDNSDEPFTIFDYNSTSQQFSLILTVQNPSTQNNQTLRVSVIALNDVP